MNTKKVSVKEVLLDLSSEIESAPNKVRPKGIKVFGNSSCGSS